MRRTVSGSEGALPLGGEFMPNNRQLKLGQEHGAPVRRVAVGSMYGEGLSEPEYKHAAT